MREHPREAAAFWLNLGSKTEVNELFREWRPCTRRSVPSPRTNLWKLREFVVADPDVERR
jgi:hypothetical protein